MVIVMNDETYKREIIEASKQLWKDNYDDEFGYVSEKLDKLNNVTVDNYWVAIQMFDLFNQSKLHSRLSADAQKIMMDYLR